MATPRAAEHRDLEQRIRDLEDQVRELTGAALRRSQLRVDSGDFVVSGGGSVYVREGGDLIVEHADGSEAVRVSERYVDFGDGPIYYGTGLSVSRPDSEGGGQTMYVGNNVLGGADYEVFDAQGNRYLASDGTTGYGLAIPHLSVPIFNVGDGFRTTSGWADAFGCQFEAWGPFLDVGMLVWPTDSTQCRLRLNIDGVPYTGGGDEVRTVIGSAGPYLETWRVSLHDRFALGSAHELSIEVRQGSGTDEVRAAPYYVRFGQS